MSDFNPNVFSQDLNEARRNRDILITQVNALERRMQQKEMKELETRQLMSQAEFDEYVALYTEWKDKFSSLRAHWDHVFQLFQRQRVQVNHRIQRLLLPSTASGGRGHSESAGGSSSGQHQSANP
eukprot:CAMPEP_0178831374 /NCGR_PEP_ID=MMETSP0746-20121128/9419_1 /TAXON_ID=913974 /ORGANISM="Nitzschia punctata, Strain CCMP561" /LENGTH=124 /DNA_ID=CAMNT_0020493597 /DNA_START=117 /DNA_END=488 /DNA_ORIENTATION=+